METEENVYEKPSKNNHSKENIFNNNVSHNAYVQQQMLWDHQKQSQNNKENYYYRYLWQITSQNV